MTVKSETKAARRQKNPDDRKIVRSMSITNKAWDAIKEKAVAEGLSASEFLERVGRDASVLETPLNSRLKAFLEPPIPIFWSLSEAIRRLAVQLCLAESFTVSGLKKHEIEERIQQQKYIVSDYLWRAMLIIAVINYGIPELDINSMTCLLRWMSFKMMLSEPQNRDLTDSTTAALITKQQIEEDLKNIQIALKLLQNFSASYYEILDMIINGNMSFAQIAKYKRLHTQKHFTEAKVRREARLATYQIRSYLHKEVVDFEKNTKHNEKTQNNLEEYKIKYYQLCALPYLQKEDIENLETILHNALEDRELEFWIREIDHLAGHHLGNFDSAHNNPEYQDIHYELREELEKKLKDGEGKDSFYHKLTEMDKKLMFCKSFEEIQNVVNKLVLEISKESLQLSDIKRMMI